MSTPSIQALYRLSEPVPGLLELRPYLIAAKRSNEKFTARSDFSVQFTQSIDFSHLMMSQGYKE
jgi:hypothetical protein